MILHYYFFKNVLCVCGLFLYVLSFEHTNRQESDVRLGQ
jgi:hypothetical protein